MKNEKVKNAQKRIDELFDKQYIQKIKLTVEEQIEYINLLDVVLEEERNQAFYEAIENCDFIMG